MATASALIARTWKHVRDPSIAMLLTTLLSVALRLGSNLVLAHLLVPKAFGLVAITTMFATALSMLSDTGMWLSIVRKGDKLDREWLDQLWSLHVVRGVALTAVSAALAPVMAIAYGEPILGALIAVSCISFLIGGFESLERFVRTKDLRPGLGLKLQLFGQVVGAIVSISGALIYPSPWALVAGMLTTSTAFTIMSHVWSGGPLPRFRLTRDFMREQWKLARWLIVSTGLGFFGGQIDRVLFPAWFGTTEFGVYSLAITLALFPLQFGQTWADNVYMPAIAKLSVQKDSRAERDLRSLGRTVAIYAGTACAMIAALGRPFFLALYPNQFAAAATFVQVLAITTYATFLTYLHRRTFLYQGLTRLEASLEASRVILFLGALGIVVALGYRLSAVEYVALYAAAQVAVYVGLLVIGRIKHLVHFRDDLAGHAVFLLISVGLILFDLMVEQWAGPVAGLLATGVTGGLVCLAVVAKLGLPKLPGSGQPMPRPADDLVDPTQGVEQFL